MPPHASPPRTAGAGLSVSAVLVAAGMLISRVAGYFRAFLFSYVFGLGSVADAFTAALRIPNFLQNLLGEGVLSASLIPVYAGLLKKEHRAGADQVARAILAILALISALLVLAGLAWAPALVTLTTPGFEGAKRELTIQLVRILFPGIGLLVISAWCLAILNSHHKFFLSYVAPVLWNGAIIVALLDFSRVHEGDLAPLAMRLAWAAVIGTALQLGVQLPGVWRVMSFKRSLTPVDVGGDVRRVLLTSVPVVFTRGVVQVSAYIDSMIASWLPPNAGAVAALANQQQLYQLPVSLFGMAISSAALPTMSVAVADRLPDALRRQLVQGQEMIVALVVPSVVAFVALGDVMVGMLFEHGRFTHDNTIYVWGILAGSSVGLIATTVGRLYANAFYALGDTRTPTTFALLRVLLVAGLGYLLAIVVPPLVHVPLRWGAAGLTISAGFAGWVEFLLLRHALEKRIGDVSVSFALMAKAWVAAAGPAAIATGLRWLIPEQLVVVRGVAMLGIYGVLYLFIAHRMRLLAANDLLRRVFRRGRVSRNQT